MKKSTLRQFIALFAFIAVVVSFASCNRGYGCPTNFSAGDVVTEVVEVVGKAILRK